jgi:prophage regulatory protein
MVTIFNKIYGELSMVKIIHRLPQVQKILGLSRSSIYGHITQGLFPKPIQLGARAVGWPSYEVEAILQARIAGVSSKDIQYLVLDLMSQRVQNIQGEV